MADHLDARRTAGVRVNCVTACLYGGVWYVAEAQRSFGGSGLPTRLKLTAANERVHK